MPYCNDCEKYWTPNSMHEDGSCPGCGACLEDPPHAGAVQADENDHADEKVPWHFKLMVVALVAYLVWRFVEIGIKIFT